MSFQKSRPARSRRALLLGLMIVLCLCVAPQGGAWAGPPSSAATVTSAGTRAQAPTTRERHRSGRKAKRGGASKGAASNFLFKTSANVVPNQQGKVVVFAFKNDDGEVSTQVAQLLDARGLQVMTGVRPVDTVTQFRDVATSLGVAAFVDGEIKGTEERMRVIVRLRNGYSGRKVAEATFTDAHSKMPGQISSKLWAKLGGTMARACVDARKTRRKSRDVMQINAGTEVETVPNSKFADAR